MKIKLKYEIIIDRNGLGHAVVVCENGKIIDCFIDPPSYSIFYPPNTFLFAKIERKMLKMGGYFIRLPNGRQGFLKSKIHYIEGESIMLQSKVFYDPKKPQTFSDTLKITSKFFILKLDQKGILFSKKLNKNFDRDGLIDLVKSNSDLVEDILVICRSSVKGLSKSELKKQLENILQRFRDIKYTLSIKQIYFDGLAKNVALEKYKTNSSTVFEDEGIFESIGIWDKLAEIKQGKLNLNNGSYLIIEQTSAFLAIDINSGKDHKISNIQINLASCIEIARVIKIFGYGGKISIDFLSCSREQRKKIYKQINLSFSNDYAENKIWGWTKGGIFELQRERDKTPLNLLLEDH